MERLKDKHRENLISYEEEIRKSKKTKLKKSGVILDVEQRIG